MWGEPWRGLSGLVGTIQQGIWGAVWQRTRKLSSKGPRAWQPLGRLSYCTVWGGSEWAVCMTCWRLDHPFCSYYWAGAAAHWPSPWRWICMCWSVVGCNGCVWICAQLLLTLQVVQAGCAGCVLSHQSWWTDRSGHCRPGDTCRGRCCMNPNTSVPGHLS